MKQVALSPWRWSREAYERMVDLGAFDRVPVELVAGQLIVAEPQGSSHVYRDPAPDPAALHGWRYASTETLGPSATVAPLALPSVRLSVSSLLP